MDVKGHAVTPSSVQKTSVGQVASRRLKQVAEKTAQGISVSSALIFSRLERVN